MDGDIETSLKHLQKIEELNPRVISTLIKLDREIVSHVGSGSDSDSEQTADDILF